MPADILVVTPSTSLGETIRQTMEQTDIYRVHIVNNKISAVVSANKIGVPLVMLDLALGEEVVDETVIALRTIRTGINIVILCDDGASVPLFDSLRPWILVRKPFRMTDFMSAISQPQQPTPATQNVDTSTPWLNDATKAAQLLGWTPRYGMEEGLRRTIAWYTRFFEEQRQEAARSRAVVAG